MRRGNENLTNTHITHHIEVNFVLSWVIISHIMKAWPCELHPTNDFLFGEISHHIDPKKRGIANSKKGVFFF
jgi:hypothetical protein